MSYWVLGLVDKTMGCGGLGGIGVGSNSGYGRIGGWVSHIGGLEALLPRGFPGVSGRRLGYPSRPPTPPYVRSRMRRFIAHAGAAVPCPVPTPSPVDQSGTSAWPGSCATPRHSTRGHARSTPISRPARRRARAAAGGAGACAAVSTAATGCTATCGEPSHGWPAGPSSSGPA